MIATLALVLAVNGTDPQPNAFLADFGGTWSCAAPGQPASRWEISRAPGSRWVRVDWGVDPATGAVGGTAYVGHVAALHKWVYRDFHGDGAYADLTSNGPQGGVWEWTGPYYPYDGGTLEGHVQWKRSDATHITRTFIPETGPRSGDLCTLTP